MGSKTSSIERLRALDRERMHLSRAAAVLQWDQETCLPPGGVEDRAEQLAILEGLAHEKLVAGEIGDLLCKLEESSNDSGADGSGTDKAGANRAGEAEAGFPVRDFLRVLRRDYERAVKLPGDFVRSCARAEGLSQAAWVEARRTKDFAAFAPHLEKMIDCARKKAEF